MATPAHAQRWSAPDGVHLVQTVSIEALSSQGGSNYLRARLTLPEFAKANVRTEGRRVYVDVTWPLAEDDVRMPRRAAQTSSEKTTSEAPASAPAREDTRQAERYSEAIVPIQQRIAEVKPFLLSAAQSDSVDVMAALDQTLASLEASLVAVSASVPLPEAGQHQLLLSATRVARRGLEPGFTGDRLAHAQKAITMFDGAMAPSVTPAAQ